MHFDEHGDRRRPAEQDRLTRGQARKVAEKTTQIVWDKLAHESLIAIIDDAVHEEGVALREAG